MKAHPILLWRKYANVIKEFCDMQNVDYLKGLNAFYNSKIRIYMRDGISDMHCRSDKYLAEEIGGVKNSCR